MNAENPTHEDDAPAATPRFADLGLDPRIVRALDGLGFESPTPIQAEALPPLLAGRDVIGRARTGAGKTAAFGLPLLQNVRDGGRTVRALVLAPTRELAVQVSQALETFASELPVEIATVYGGAGYGPQLRALRKGVPVVVGTPGRIIDHMDRGTLDLSELDLLVLDEADEMLRMGFFEDVERVFSEAPDECQVALFSATMPPRIKAIAERRLRDPLEIQVEAQAMTTKHIAQRALLVPDRNKLEALSRVLAAEEIEAVLIFARTRVGCAEVADHLAHRGHSVDALHGDLNQAARERVLARFRAGRLKIVVATDVAARGIDVERISHVINLDLTPDPETYVHRIGRTGRAGRDGVAISFVTPKEAGKLRFFEKKLKTEIERVEVPSDAELGRRDRDRLVADLREHLAEDPGEGVRSLLEELEEGGVDARAVAMATLNMVAASRGFRLDVDLDNRPPVWAQKASSRASKKGNDRGRDRYERRDRDDRGPRPPRGERRSFEDEIELFIPVGRARGVRPGDVVGALANEGGIPGGAIGRVTILDHKSFVRVAKDEAEGLLRDHHQIELRGRQVPLAKARPMGDRGPGGGPDRAPGWSGKRRGPGGSGGPGGFRGKGGPHGPKRFNRKK